MELQHVIDVEQHGKSNFTNVTFSNLDYFVNGKQILFNISGSIKSGEILTILGPSKSGKTKLLNVLSGRTLKFPSKTQITKGQLLSETNDYFSLLRPGFVARSLSGCQTSSVKEEIEFSVLFQSGLMKKSERAILTNEILELINLKPKENVLVKKLTKGEQKILSIGVELGSLPNVLFLDEPNYLVDSESSVMIMKILKKLSNHHGQYLSNCLIVQTLKDPNSDIFAELSQVLLLGHGHTLYYGHANHLGTAFKNCSGVEDFPSTNYNPSDYVLKCIRKYSLNELKGDEQQAPLVERHELVHHGDNLVSFRRRNLFVYFFQILKVRESQKGIDFSFTDKK